MILGSVPKHYEGPVLCGNYVQCSFTRLHSTAEYYSESKNICVQVRMLQLSLTSGNQLFHWSWCCRNLLCVCWGWILKYGKDGKYDAGKNMLLAPLTTVARQGCDVCIVTQHQGRENTATDTHAHTHTACIQQSTIPLFIPSCSRNSLDSRWEGDRERHRQRETKRKSERGSTKERRDREPWTQRDCRVKLPLVVSTVHLPHLRSTWGRILEYTVGVIIRYRAPRGSGSPGPWHLHALSSLCSNSVSSVP